LKCLTEICITKYHDFNVDLAKFDNTVYKILKEFKLDVVKVGINGRIIVPRDWFGIPLGQIDFVTNETITKVIILE
jgi:hypothetical protein